MAELSQYFGFLTIFKDSFKLLSKNGKLMAPITLVSLLLPSLLLLAFCYIFKILTNSIINATDSSNLLPPIAYLYLSLLLVFEIACIIAYVKISKLSGIATIIVSATSYTGAELSSQDLCSRVKATSDRSKVFGFRSSYKRGMTVLAIIVWMVVIFAAIFYPGPITITVAVVVGVPVLGFLLYASVGTVLSSVVSVVEEKFEGPEAVERAEELIQGQRHHGFMVVLVMNLVLLGSFLGVWLVLGDRLRSLNAVGIWFGLVNLSSLVKIFTCVASTVLYFRCEKYNGEEEVCGVANFDYSKLPTSNLGDGGHADAF